MSVYFFKTDKKVKLSELLEKNGIYIDKPCGGNGKCGKCKVKAQGHLSPLTDEEKAVLSVDEILSSMRLVCKTYVKGTVEVEIDDLKEKAFGSYEENVPECYAAVDIGTTVVEAYFFSLPDFKLIKKVKEKNPQIEFGADVCSRLSAAEDEEKRMLMQKSIKTLIEKMAMGLNVSKWVITGNTVMLHLYSGINPKDMAQYPFAPKTLFGYQKENIYYPQCFSSYVGADIYTSILASNMLKEKSPSMLIDIGTNGEIVLFDGEKLYLTSTAAGPALEASTISMGMIAKDGAIKTINKNGDCEIVGNCDAKGICASGLVDAIAYMLSNNIITKEGYLENPYKIKGTKVSITPKDIRNIQLCKGAIRSGIETILQETGIKASNLKTVYISGTLGNSLDIENAMKIRLLPRVAKDKFKLIGNGALNGAEMLLKGIDFDENEKKIINNAEVFELALKEKFCENYMKYISF